TVSTALRFHPGELVLSLPLRLLAVAALGAPVAAIVAFEGLFAVANLVEHGDIDLPAALERRLGTVVVTPALHRFHHTRGPIERNRNYGTIFVFWDRWLRSYGPSSSARAVDVGLDDLRESIGVRAALLLPLARLPR